MRLKFIIPALVVITLFSCKASKLPMTTGKGAPDPQIVIVDTAVSLTGHKWYLTKIHSDTANSPTSRKAFIKFDTVKGSAGGNASCNTFGSTFTADGNKITIKNIFSTKMYCEGVQQTENSFLDQLGKASRYEIKGNTLFLFGNKETLLEFTGE